MVIGFIVFIAPTTAACEALFFTGARKLHTGCKKPFFDGKALIRLYLGSSRCARPLALRLCPPCRTSHSLHSSSLRRTFSLEKRKWRRGELNPCPRRYPRKHLHVYPVRFLRSRRCTGTLPTSERPRISFTVRRGRSAVRLACCPRLAP